MEGSVDVTAPSADDKGIMVSVSVVRVYSLSISMESPGSSDMSNASKSRNSSQYAKSSGSLTNGSDPAGDDEWESGNSPDMTIMSKD